jgi:hypothetical protein
MIVSAPGGRGQGCQVIVQHLAATPGAFNRNGFYDICPHERWAARAVVNAFAVL